MKRFLSSLIFLLVASSSLDLARAQTIPRGAFGNVELAAGVVTKIPLAGLPGRRAISVQNLGGAEIWCAVGTDPLPAALTAANGIKVPAEATASFTMSYINNTVGPWVWCLSVAGQTSPADTRWLETR